MSDSSGYHELLDATMAHLRDLQARGVRYVPVQAETMRLLERPVPRRPASPTPETMARAATSPGDIAETTPVPENSQIKPDSAALISSQETSPSFTSLQGEDKVRALEELRARAMVCVKCAHLASSRKNVVFGVGSLEAALMFVGEAPGADEDAQGEPFVGKAGELLTKIIQTMGLRRQDVYIANILKCRPDTPGQRYGNRKPAPEEMKTCIPYLHGQIDLIRPRVLVALGATAVEGLLGKTQGIMRLRGNWQTYRGIPLMPTYHPAFLLRNQAPAEKRKVWEDMLQVMEKLDMAISDKQRSYFLKST